MTTIPINACPLSAESTIIGTCTLPDGWRPNKSGHLVERPRIPGIVAWHPKTLHIIAIWGDGYAYAIDRRGCINTPDEAVRAMTTDPLFGAYEYQPN